MSYINLGILILLGIALIAGFIIGFGKKSVAAFANIVGSVAGWFLAHMASNALMTIAFGNEIITGLFMKVLPADSAALSVNPISTDMAERTEQLSAGLGDLKIPQFFRSLFISNVKVVDNSVGRAIASSFAYLTILAVSFIVIYLTIVILIKVICGPHGKNGVSIFGENGKNVLGRIAGMALQLFRASCSVLAILCIIVFVSSLLIKFGNITVLQDWIDKDLALESPIDFNIGSMFYKFANSLLGGIGLLK